MHEEFEALKARLARGEGGTVTSRDGEKHIVELRDGKIYRKDNGAEVVDYSKFSKESVKLNTSVYMSLVAAYGLPVQVGNRHIFIGSDGSPAAVYQYGK